LPHVRSRARSLEQSLRPVRAGRACCGERGCSPFAHFDRPPPMHPVRVNSMKKPRPCRPPSVPPTPVVTPRASLSRCRPISDVRCRSTGRPNRFSSTGPSSRRATTSRCASHPQPASPGARVSRPVLEDEPDCAPNAFRRSSVLTRAFSRQCISALTRPGFTSKIPHPFHSRACFPTHDPVRKPPADGPTGTSCRRLQPTFIRLSKTSTRVSLATGFVLGLRPFLPGGAARFTASHPARGVPATRTREHCPLSHPVSDRTSRRPVAPLVAQPAGLPPRDV
jgi:hypothetical protein